MVVFFKCFFIKLSSGEIYLMTESRDPPTVPNIFFLHVLT